MLAPVHVVIAVALLAGCATRAAESAWPSPVASAQPAEASPMASEFFVVAEGLDGDNEDPSRLRLSGVTNAAVLDYPPLVYQGGRFRDVGFGKVSGLVGTWPDELWGFREPPCAAKEQDYSRCPFGLEVVHWNQNAWTRQGFVKLELSRWTPHWLEVWPGGRAVAITEIRDRAGEFYSAVKVFGKRPHPQLPALANSSYARHVTEVKRIGENEVLVLMTQPIGDLELKTSLERWVGNRLVASTSEPDGKGLLVVNSWFDMLKFGARFHRAAHFDGKSWSKFELPPWGEVGLAYAREPNGTQWVIMGIGIKNVYGEPSDGILYRKRPGGAWMSVALPHPAFAHEHGDRLVKPTNVSVRGPGDVWVRGWYYADRVRGVLLHDRKPTEICFLERYGEACRSRPK